MGRKRLEEALARAVEAGRQLERQQIVAQTARQIFTEEIREVLEALTSTEAALDYISRAIPRWIDRWRQRMAGPLLQQMQTSELPTDRGPVSLGFDLANPKLQAFFDDYTLKLSTQITDTTRQRLEQIIRGSAQDGSGVDETARRIREVGEEFAGRRATLIARNELHRATVGASEIQARESGVIVSRTWLSAQDERVRPLHRALNGQIAGFDEEFAPGVKSPADEIACRCTLLFNIDPALTGGS